MRTIRALAEQTKIETDGYFDSQTPEHTFDPSGVVKGWAIQQAALMLKESGVTDFYVEIGGDIETSGTDDAGKPWSVGIRNPFKKDEIVKVVYPDGHGIATSGTYLRGNHIYNPHTRAAAPEDFVSLTVIGPNVYEADRFATAAFAMGFSGLAFLEALPEFEAFGITPDARSFATSGFSTFTQV
jgi:thiamine biosynthesis lipoprotein